MAFHFYFPKLFSQPLLHQRRRSHMQAVGFSEGIDQMFPADAWMAWWNVASNKPALYHVNNTDHVVPTPVKPH